MIISEILIKITKKFYKPEYDLIKKKGFLGVFFFLIKMINFQQTEKKKKKMGRYTTWTSCKILLKSITKQ